MSIRVLVADDQDIVRTGLRMILDAQPGIEVVLDGIEATRQLAGPDVDDPTAVVVITTSTWTSTSTARRRPARGASCSRTPGPSC